MVGMAIVFIYAVMGGMKGITYTQIAQYVIMIIAYTIPAIFISFMSTFILFIIRFYNIYLIVRNVCREV